MYSAIVILPTGDASQLHYFIVKSSGEAAWKPDNKPKQKESILPCNIENFTKA